MQTKFLISLITVLFLNLSAWGNVHMENKKNSLTGKVMDTQGQPIAFATIHIFENGKAEFGPHQSQITDENGTYTFGILEEGTYYLVVNSIGFKSYISEHIQFSDANGNKKSFPDIILEPESQTMAEVSIVAQKPLIERKPDMMVVNVENSSISAGNSALEILQKSPGILLDKDDNISLMGRAGVEVMINGKKSQMTGEQLATYLKGMDGNLIKSIELITNPSSKYEAAGSAGIINIVLKKNTQLGTNGQIMATAGYGRGHKANTSLNLNHHIGKWNVYGTLSYINNDGSDSLLLDRTLYNANHERTTFNQQSLLERQVQNMSFRTGVDFEVTENQNLTLEVNGNRNEASLQNRGKTKIGNTFQQTDSILISQADGPGAFNSLGGNLSYNLKLDENGSKWVTQVDVSQFFRNSITEYNNSYTLANGQPWREAIITKSATPTTIDIRVANTDYTHVWEGGSKIETGLRYSEVETTNLMDFKNRNASQWEQDLSKTNEFNYQEKISAAYITYHKQWGKVGIQAGLRGEYTQSIGESTTLNQIEKRDYLDLFPTLFMSYGISENHSSGFSISRRVNRPQYSLMNPFKYFIDQYTYQSGNPDLKPEYSWNLDLNYSFKNKYHLSLGGSLTDDVIAEVMGQDEDAKSTYVTRVNLHKQKSAYMNLFIPVQIQSWWNTHTNINAFYLGFEGNLEDVNLDKGKAAFNISNQHMFKIQDGFNLDMNIQYNSPLSYSIYDISQTFAVDLGLSKSILNKKGNLKLSVSDVLATRKHIVKTNFSNLNVYVNQKHENTIARLTFTYSFGNKKTTLKNSNMVEKTRVGN